MGDLGDIESLLRDVLRKQDEIIDSLNYVRTQSQELKAHITALENTSASLSVRVTDLGSQIKRSEKSTIDKIVEMNNKLTFISSGLHVATTPAGTVKSTKTAKKTHDDGF